MTATLASKADVQAVRADIAKLASTTKEDIAKLDKELAVLKWMVGLVMAGVAAQILKAFFV